MTSSLTVTLVVAPDARSIPGHGAVITRKPPSSLPTDVPSCLMTSAETPGSAFMAAPGLVAVIPGRGLIKIPPVSVCHQVSTIGHRPPPMWVRYQIHASGLIGSPTDPSRRSELRSWAAGRSSPHFMKVRIVVGAVYKSVTL